MSDHDSRFSLDRFAALAAEFCVLIESRADKGPQELLRTAHRLMAELYATVLHLPVPPSSEAEESIEDDDEALARWTESLAAPDPDDIGHDAWRALFDSLQQSLGDRRWYRQFFDPYDESPESEVRANLADDLADIYRDLTNGLRKWDRGERREAHETWRYTFEAHWGRHASGAMMALYCMEERLEEPWADADL